MNVDGFVIEDRISTHWTQSMGITTDDLEILIKNVIAAFKDVGETLKDIITRFNEQVEEVLEVIFKNKCDYPPYKTKYRTVKFFNKKIYYNCRNTC